MNIFISYSSENRRLIRNLVADLEKAGYSVWYDPNLSGGDEWWAKILEKIRMCHVFIFAITTKSIASIPCRLEYEYAIDLNKPFIPLMMADIQIKTLPSSLQKLQAVHCQMQTKEEILALIKALNNFSEPINRPLPLILPKEPETPLSPYAVIRDQLDAPTLTRDEQILIVSNIKELLDDDEMAVEAWDLLEMLQKRDDLLDKTGKEIGRLIAHKPKEFLPLQRRYHLEPRTIGTHDGRVNSVAFAPSGLRVLSGGQDFLAIYWDVISGDKLCQLIGHKDVITSVAISKDGHYGITGSNDNTAIVWELETGRKIHHLIGHSKPVNCVAFSHHGNLIATASVDQTAILWEKNTGKELLKFSGHRNSVTCVVFSPDDAFILTGSYDNTIKLWDTASGEQVTDYLGHTSWIQSICFSPDGDFILSGSHDNTVRLWKTSNAEFVRPFNGHQSYIEEVTFSHDGKYLLSSDLKIRVWELTVDQPIHRIEDFGGVALSLAFSPDDRYVIIGTNEGSVILRETGIY